MFLLVAVHDSNQILDHIFTIHKNKSCVLLSVVKSSVFVNVVKKTKQKTIVDYGIDKDTC